MSRVKRGKTGHAKHKKVLKAVKGQWGRRKNTIRVARQAMEKAMQYAYRDRKKKKSTFRALWIIRINAAARQNNLSYSKLMHGLKSAGVEIDRKMLADLAVHDADAFKAISDKARTALENA